VAQGAEPVQTQGGGRLPLALGHRRHTAPHHLGNEGAGVDHQCGEQGGELHRDPQRRLPHPIHQLGRRPAQALPEPAGQTRPIQPRFGEHQARQLQRRRAVGQGQEHHEVPEDQLQQQRNVAHHL
ncbi:MAG: hypothetical protein ACK56I_02615, partial [bacterium]